MEYGAHLPLISFRGEQRTLGDLIAFTTAARDLGYEYLCANDHLVFARPWLDGPIALAAVLAHAGDMRLVTSLSIPIVRGPAATAKALAALDILSNGRMIVGVGPGSSARDYQLVGLDFEERWARLGDAVGALRAFWSGQPFEGRYYSTIGFSLDPRPIQQPSPPIWIGSWGSASGLRRVARIGDGWLASGYNTTPELFEQGRMDLQADVAKEGRFPAPGPFPNAIATMWTYVTPDRAKAESMLTDVLAPMLNRPVDELRAKLPVGPAEECAVKLSAYAKAGAQRVFIWPLADEVNQLALFQEEVVPLVQPM